MTFDASDVIFCATDMVQQCNALQVTPPDRLRFRVFLRCKRRENASGGKRFLESLRLGCDGNHHDALRVRGALVLTNTATDAAVRNHVNATGAQLDRGSPQRTAVHADRALLAASSHAGVA